MALLEAEIVASFRGKLRGRLIGPEDSDFEESRKVYNAMISRRPHLIAKCSDVADVIAAVHFAQANGVQLAVRGGGHNAGGLGVCDDALVADLSGIQYVRVDPASQTVRVGGGSTWGQVDHATHAFGLAVPSGIISTTGVGGLTLGGGIGHLTRKCGLTIDNLLSVDMVLADGSCVVASKDEHPDLFWAVRGGGGNFGIATSFLFKAHPVHTVCAGPMLWEMKDAPAVMDFYRDFICKAPRELNGFFAFLTVPPGPPFPEAIHLQKMCGVVWCYIGETEQAQEVLKPIRDFRKPAFEFCAPMPFPMLQGMFDALYPPGHQWYWKGSFVESLGPEAIALHAEHAAKMPTMQSSMHLYPINGAVHDVADSDTAWSYRDANWSQVIVGVDPDPENAGLITDWTRGYYDALIPHCAKGAYVNFMMEEGDERIRAAYRRNYDRLSKIKTKYDPENFFRVNQNIRPQPVP